jgi:Cd2+/Zn2+-exporting ATPase
VLVASCRRSSSAALVDWIYKALVMLVIACPCALVISTPVTVVSGLAAAARRGILIKGGVLSGERALIKVVALDKTGTITHGKPVLTDTSRLSSARRMNFCNWPPAWRPSEHPVAAAIATAWQSGATALLEVTLFEALAGRGVQGPVAGQAYYVGNHRLVEELGICSPRRRGSRLKSLEQKGKTAVVLASDDASRCGVFGVADTVRETQP